MLGSCIPIIGGIIGGVIGGITTIVAQKTWEYFFIHDVKKYENEEFTLVISLDGNVAFFEVLGKNFTK